MDRLLKQARLTGLHPVVLAAALNRIFRLANKCITSDFYFPKELNSHRVNSLNCLIDTIRSSNDLNSAKFGNLNWGTVSFYEAKTGRKRRTAEKITRNPKRTNAAKKTPRPLKKKATKNSKAGLRALRGNIPSKVQPTLLLFC